MHKNQPSNTWVEVEHNVACFHGSPCNLVKLLLFQIYDDGEVQSDSHVNVLTLPHVLDLPVSSPDPAMTSDDPELTSDDCCEVYVVKFACGSRHSVAVTSDGRAYSWGWNDHGQLGHGDLVSRDHPTVIQFFVEQNLRVLDVFAGYWNSVFATS